MKRPSLFRFLGRWTALTLISVLGAGAWAQDTTSHAALGEAPSLLGLLSAMQQQVRELGFTLRDLRDEAARSRAELLELRRELAATRAQLVSVNHSAKELGTQPTGPSRSSVSPPGAGGSSLQTEDSTGGRLAKVEEDQQLLSAKIDEQYQTKVESASKYRVRLSGITLLNVFANRGSVDNQDLPNLALPRGVLDSAGNFGATVRQTQLGLEIFGPKLGSAKTSADAQLDFFGGFAQTLDGVTAGLVRLRTATARLDWSRTSVVVGQDTPFISPLSPTSLASVALPAFSYAGNLWTWTPQIRVERHLQLSEESRILLQAGVLDPLSGEPPYSTFYRSPQAGERSRQPAYATRVSWTRGTSRGPLTVGVGGYYARQNWGFGRNVDAWAGTADWTLPLSPWLALSGEFYRGRALGGLGGGIGRSVLLSGPLTDAGTLVEGLGTVGGWGQLKFSPMEKLEFNGAFGQDNPLASNFRYFLQGNTAYSSSWARNRSGMINLIYRPRSNLLFGVEYRRLRTFDIFRADNTADHVNLAVGVLF